MRESEAGRPAPGGLHRRSWWRVALTGATAALVCGFLDLTWHWVLERPHLEDWRLLVLPLTALTVVVLGLFGVLFLGLRALLARFMRPDARRLALALGCSLIVGVFLVSSSGLLNSPPSRDGWLLLFGYLMMAGGVGAAAYRLARSADHGLLARVDRLLSALPFVLGLALLWLFGYAEWRSALSIAARFAAAGLCLAVALAIFWLFARLGSRSRDLAVLSLLAVIVLPASAALAWEHRVPAVATPVGSLPRGPNVILVTIDTLRADPLGCYGASNAATPNLDLLARDGVVFERALSAAPWTLPAMASILTGVSPSLHQATRMGGRLPRALITVAEELGQAGYATAAVGRNPHLKARSNLSKGFDRYSFFPKWGVSAALGTGLVTTVAPRALAADASTSELAELAIGWIERQAAGRFFLWLHFFDPHLPYEPPPPFRPQGTPPSSLGYRFDDVVGVRGGYWSPTAEERSWIRRLYEGEIRYVDHEVGRLIGALKRLRLYDESVILVSSDHGEEFWEHGGFEHGHSLYEEVVRVPLLVKPPAASGAERTGRVRTAVSSQSIMATILDLAGVSFGGAYPLSPSLRPLWEGSAQAAGEQAFAREPIILSSVRYFEDQIAATFGDYKLIRWRVSGRTELYDLASDPDESRSLVASRPQAAARGQRILARHRATSRRWAAELGIAEGGEVSPPTGSSRDELKSLGYIR